MKYLLKKILIPFLAVMLVVSCKDQWETHNALNHAVLAETLEQLVSTTPSLSTFNEYLKKTGYDKILASSKVFTVWAPSNDALSGLDQSIVNDTAKLKQFVSNHIAYQEYPMEQTSDIKIKMINGKNLPYSYHDKKIDSIALDTTKSDQFCRNGILHLISAPIYPKDNIWTYFMGQTDASVSTQQSYLSLTVKTFDQAHSVPVGTNSDGNTIYDTVWVNKNIFLSNVCDVSNEDSVYTFFVLNNTVSDNEAAILKPYMADTTKNPLLNMTNIYAYENAFVDVVVRGKYTRDNLPDSFYSTNGIKIYKQNIVIENYYNASNGSVFTVSGFHIPLKDKIPTIVIEGENFSSLRGTNFNYLTRDKVPLLGIRARSWASGGYDVQVPGGTTGHVTPYLGIGYYSPYLYTLTYQVYWRAVNDFQSSSFTQKLAIVPDSLTPGRKLVDISAVSGMNYIRATQYRGDTLVKMKTVQPNIFSEVLLGKLTNPQYSRLWIYLAANEINSGSYNDPIVLDYIKLVPVIN